MMDERAAYEALMMPDGKAAYEALMMLEEGLGGEISKVRFITAMADYCPDPEELFSFTDEEESKRAWRGFMAILEGVIKAYDDLSTKLEKIQSEGKNLKAA